MWIIQNIFGEETESLIRVLDRSNIPYILEDNPYNYLYVSKFEKPIIRGSIDFLENYSKNNHNRNFNLTLENYTYTKYSQHFGVNLLNHDYIVLPWWSLKHNQYLINQVFDTEKIFIRPNSGRKIFTGTTLSKLRWAQELEIIKSLPSSNISDEDLVIVSSHKEIESEYRLVMYKNELLGYSIYSGQPKFFDEDAIEYWAKRNTYFPDKFYTIDIAFLKDSVRILEINSFVSAGLYDIDYDYLVKRIKEINNV